MSTLGRESMLARDPALPERDVLLDAAAVAERFAAVAAEHGGVVGACRLRRAKYRIGESLRVVYDVEVDGVVHTIAGRMGTAPVRPVDDAPAGALWPPPVHTTAELHTTWWTFPHDRKLHHLDAVLTPAPSLVAAVPTTTSRSTNTPHNTPQVEATTVTDTRTDTSWSHSELVEYAPEHCATVRCLDAAGRVVGYAKAYRPDVGDRLPAMYGHIAEHAARTCVVRTPRPLAWSAAHDVLVLEAMPGQRWADVGPTELPVLLGLLGPAVAWIHQIPVGPARRFGRLLPARVVHSAELVAMARPELAGVCAALTQRLRHGPPGGATDDVLLHGDIHPGNALLDDGAVNLIDLDQSGIGAAAADIGSLAARLHYRNIVDAASGTSGTSGGELFAAFTAGYASVRPLPPPAVLRWHTAAALVAERAIRAVNRVHRDALPHLEAVLANALHLLQEGTDDGF